MWIILKLIAFSRQASTYFSGADRALFRCIKSEKLNLLEKIHNFWIVISWRDSHRSLRRKKCHEDCLHHLLSPSTYYKSYINQTNLLGCLGIVAKIRNNGGLPFSLFFHFNCLRCLSYSESNIRIKLRNILSHLYCSVWRRVNSICIFYYTIYIYTLLKFYNTLPTCYQLLFQVIKYYCHKHNVLNKSFCISYGLRKCRFLCFSKYEVTSQNFKWIIFSTFINTYWVFHW